MLIPRTNHHLHILQGIASTMPSVPVNTPIVFQTIRIFQGTCEVSSIQITMNKMINVNFGSFVI